MFIYIYVCMYALHVYNCLDDVWIEIDMQVDGNLYRMERTRVCLCQATLAISSGSISFHYLFMFLH